MDAAILALLASGAASTAGSVYNTQKQLELAAQNNNTSIELSNTAHQREVVDLLKAGINPVLTSSGSGASVPTMQTAKTENALAGLSDGISSASQYLTKQYRQGLEQQAIVTDGERLANKSQQINNSAARTQLQIMDAQKYARLAEADADYQEAKLREEQSKVDRAAFADASGHLGRKHLAPGLKKTDSELLRDYVKLRAEGFTSSAKDVANSNWRNNTKIGLDVFDRLMQLVPSSKIGRGAGKGLPMTLRSLQFFK